MRLNLWMSQPETERKLATALRLAVVVFACWALAAAYGLWSTRTALASSRRTVASQGKKVSDMSREIPRKRREAARADHVKVAVSVSAASADLASELARIAQVSGVEIAGVRVGGDGPQGKASAASSSGKATTGASPPAPAPTSDGWDQETFESNVSGEYDALTRFLSVLAESPHVIDITSVEVTQVGSGPSASSPHLEMKLDGIVYALPVKS